MTSPQWQHLDDNTQMTTPRWQLPDTTPRWQHPDDNAQMSSGVLSFGGCHLGCCHLGVVICVLSSGWCHLGCWHLCVVICVLSSGVLSSKVVMRSDTVPLLIIYWKLYSLLKCQIFGKVLIASSNSIISKLRRCILFVRPRFRENHLMRLRPCLKLQI
jgi:hypothetical protein